MVKLTTYPENTEAKRRMRTQVHRMWLALWLFYCARQQILSPYQISLVCLVKRFWSAPLLNSAYQKAIWNPPNPSTFGPKEATDAGKLRSAGHWAASMKHPTFSINIIICPPFWEVVARLDVTCPGSHPMDFTLDFRCPGTSCNAIANAAFASFAIWWRFHDFEPLPPSVPGSHFSKCFFSKRSPDLATEDW